MSWLDRRPLRVFARGASMRRRVAYSLAIVRLILVPVILLPVYYLYRMDSIVNRIVSMDAPAATLAQRVSIEMMAARRAERSYFLLHDPQDLEVNRQSLSNLDDVIGSLRELDPEEAPAANKMLEQLSVYRRQFDYVVASLGAPSAPIERIQRAVRVYEADLEKLLGQSRGLTRAELTAELRQQVGSFDAQITTTLESEDPELRSVTAKLQASSDEVLKLAPEVEARSWDRVRRDQVDARHLVYRAEWVLIIVSSITLTVSVLVSFVLPRAVVKPLMDLKDAVDRAAAGDYETIFHLQGKGELVQLADSVRSLIAHVREKKTNGDVEETTTSKP